MADLLSLPMTETSQVGDARRQATSLARGLGFGEADIGKVAVVVSEVARNLVSHATGGELILRPLDAGGTAGVEILALDRGPGMVGPEACLRDGYSSTGSSGIGLGAVARLSASFDIHSVPGLGTALIARLWSGPLPPPHRRRALRIGVICLAQPGEEVPGDGWAAEHRPGRSLLFVSDGSGHGPLAAEASREAASVFRQRADLGPAAVLEAAHAALRGTRGASVAVAEIDLLEQVARFAGVGNIGGVLLSPDGSRNMVSFPGTVGHQLRRIQEFTYPWSERTLLVMYSDGLAARWRLDRYPGLAERHPSLVAGVLYRDYRRGHDDVTVLAAKTGDEWTDRG